MTTGNLKLAFIIEAIDRATAPVRKVNQLIEKLAAPAQKVSEAYRNLTSTINGVGRAAAVAGIAATAGFAGFKRIADSVDKINDTAIDLGITTQQLQRMGYAAQLSGASQEELAQSLIFLNKNMNEARGGSEEMIDTFASIGITLKQLNTPGYNAVSAFEQMGERYHNAAETATKGTEMIATSTKLLGRSGFRMNQFLQAGRAAMRELYLEADRLGVTLSEDTVKSMVEFNDGWDRMRLTLFGAIATAFRPVGVALKAVTDRITNWTAANRELINTRVEKFVKDVSDAMPAFIKGAEELWTGLKRVVAVIDSFSVAVGGWPNLLALIAGVIGAKVVLQVYALAAAIGVLNAAAWANPLTLVLAAVSVLVAAMPLAILHWETLTGWFEKAFNWLTKLNDSSVVQAIGRIAGVADQSARPSGTGGATGSSTGSFENPNFRVAAGVAGASAQLGGVLDINLNAEGGVKSTALKKAPGSPLDFTMSYNGLSMTGF